MLRERTIAWLCCTAALLLAVVAMTVPPGTRYGIAYTDLSLLHPVWRPMAILLLACGAAAVARGSVALAWIASVATGVVLFVTFGDFRIGWFVALPALGAVELVRRTSRTAGSGSRPAEGSRLAAALLPPTVGALLWLPEALAGTAYLFDWDRAEARSGRPSVLLASLFVAAAAAGWWSLRARSVAITLWSLAIVSLLVSATPLAFVFTLFGVWLVAAAVLVLAVLAIRARCGSVSLAIAIAGAVVVDVIGGVVEGGPVMVVASVPVGLAVGAITPRISHVHPSPIGNVSSGS